MQSCPSRWFSIIPENLVAILGVLGVNLVIYMELHSSDGKGDRGKRYIRAMGDEGSRPVSVARVAETPR